MDTKEAISVIKDFLFESEKKGAWESVFDVNVFIELIQTEPELQEALLVLIKKDSWESFFRKCHHLIYLKIQEQFHLN